MGSYAQKVINAVKAAKILDDTSASEREADEKVFYESLSGKIENELCSIVSHYFEHAIRSKEKNQKFEIIAEIYYSKMEHCMEYIYNDYSKVKIALNFPYFSCNRLISDEIASFMTKYFEEEFHDVLKIRADIFGGTIVFVFSLEEIN